jgi:hypothetical protein
MHPPNVDRPVTVVFRRTVTSSGLRRGHMRQFVVTIVVVVGSASLPGAPPMQQRVVSSTPFVVEHVIVGRARCGASTWLLTDPPALVRVNVDRFSMVKTLVAGFNANEHPWGLACLANGELWTLADGRTLARMSTSGAVLERHKLPQARLNVFGVGDRLLLQQPPTQVGIPLLAAARTHDLTRSQPWPGPMALPQVTKKVDVASGLVSCGVGHDNSLPCWIASGSRITISDGTPAHTAVVQPAFAVDPTIDPRTPLQDVATAASSRVWILTSAVARESGRRVGGRLTRSNLRGERLASVDLQPRARLIVDATDNTALVLTTAGTLIEVRAP